MLFIFVCRTMRVLLVVAMLVGASYAGKLHKELKSEAKGLTGYCSKYTDRPFCLQTDEKYPVESFTV